MFSRTNFRPGAWEGRDGDGDGDGERGGGEKRAKRGKREKEKTRSSFLSTLKYAN